MIKLSFVENLLFNDAFELAATPHIQTREKAVQTMKISIHKTSERCNEPKAAFAHKWLSQPRIKLLTYI